MLGSAERLRAKLPGPTHLRGSNPNFAQLPEIRLYANSRMRRPILQPNVHNVHNPE
jgi:hypothetical protein